MKKPVRSWMYAAAAVAVAIAPVAVSSGTVTQAATHASVVAVNANRHMHIDCSKAAAMCTEVANSEHVFGHYVGHDEPSMLFYSNRPGSGNHMRYSVVLPKDPSASNPNNVNKGFAFELSGADWFGMAMCDTQSFPEQVKTCPPDTDKNILDPAVSAKHVGTAFMEMQFYPPGWVPWPTWAVAVGASSCDPTRWCAAMNIDSLSLNPVTGKANNQTCLMKVGEEYLNFAFITKNGRSTGPANPVDSTVGGTFTPSPKDLFMNPGDHLSVAFGDTPNGLRVVINDLTTHQSGSMTASKQNGFAMVKYDPNGTSCTAIPYNFHPMYSTSSTKTRVTWAAHSYNIAFDSEIGHFQFCGGPKSIPATPFGINKAGKVVTCPTGDHEGRGATTQPADGEDAFCFPAKEALIFKVEGCSFTNSGFDGASYLKLWPDGNTAMHPTPFQFSSPKTGTSYNVAYPRAAFETDLPAVENATCNVATGKGCTLIPRTSAGHPVALYPFFGTAKGAGGCLWQFGNDIPGQTSDFGDNAQYGKLLSLDYTGSGGGIGHFFEDFRGIIPNPC